jgi:hypothetical protein
MREDAMGREFDVAAQRRRSDALLREIDAVDRASVGRRRGRWGRVLTWATRLATIAVIGVLAANAWIAWDVFVDNDGSGSAPASEPSYSDLEVYDDAGHFGGEITVRNPLDDYVALMVTVDLYDGDQNVGDMSGTITMKPDSEAVVTLRGFDDYVDYTDTRVGLLGWPT